MEMSIPPAWTCSVDIPYSTVIQHGKAAWTNSMDKQQGQTAGANSRDMQQGQAARTSSMDM
jgi:hypothetical protein